ncbi:hypothetical protein PF005_g33424 [Phytophthora fragariae]|uniref:Uncharacterized protein n=1 Tax=Phytophthora fragariae TaxID=53985 RepID=A0A6A3G6R6_9STRA|nr:hypothetical protein PF011_g32745 [Phytophthora fragariae]KAE9054594.1 hypothetical protein PF006_g33216 [Phytophthora fragariae]KAE9153218.1 hypothetical protein PF005_g33424 [Phytophthora fragariae]KAE9157772.1 hypothetical protein PF002_g33291 [Phytophthora fragariae]
MGAAMPRGRTHSWKRCSRLVLLMRLVWKPSTPHARNCGSSCESRPSRSMNRTS